WPAGSPALGGAAVAKPATAICLTGSVLLVSGVLRTPARASPLATRPRSA
ncbi:hypothetical protein, partial [Pseudomonas sp. FEN]